MNGERKHKQNLKLLRISVTGPECSGKSTLARQLAMYFDTVWVHEYAVDYLNKYGPSYEIEDLVKIARGQLEIENALAKVANRRLFCDTDFVVMKIWSKEVFGEVPRWIEQQVLEHKYDLHLLTAPDLKWEPAPFRENPADRDYLFELYLKELTDNNFNFRIIRGLGDQRFKNAVTFVDELNL